MNKRRFKAGYTLFIRSVKLFFDDFPNRVIMQCRFTQMKICAGVMFKSLFE